MFKVIHVDDEKLILDGLRAMIDWERLGFTVCAQARNGREALEAVQRVRPDLIITDISMPQMDGLELIRQVNERWPDVRFIVLSGYSEFEYAQQAMQLGVRYYVLKPIEEEELEHCLSKTAKELNAQQEAEAERSILRQHSRSYLQLMQEPADPSDTGDDRRLIDRVTAYIDEHYAEPLTLAHVSDKFYINSHYLSKLFRQKTDVTFLDYVTRTRVERAKLLLQETDCRVYEIAADVGYEDTKYFSRTFERLVGMKPSEYRMRHGNAIT